MIYSVSSSQRTSPERNNVHTQQVGIRVLRSQLQLTDYSWPNESKPGQQAPKNPRRINASEVAKCGRVISVEDWLASHREQIAAAQVAKRDHLNKKIATAKEKALLKKLRKQLSHEDFDTWQPASGSYSREKIFLLDPHTEFPIGRKSGREHKKVCYRNLGRKPRHKDVPRGEDPKTSGHFRVKHVRHNVISDLITPT